MKQSQLPTEPEHEIPSNSKSKTEMQSQQWPRGGSTASTTRAVEMVTMDVQDDDFFGEDDS